MPQAVGVAQLVYGLFDCPLVEEGRVLWQAVEALAQAGQGNNRRRPAHARLAEDEVETRRVQVHVHDAQPPLNGKAQSAQPGQDGVRQVLPPPPLIGVVRVGQGSGEHAVAAESSLQPLADDGEDSPIYLADGNQGDRLRLPICTQRHLSHKPQPERR